MKSRKQNHFGLLKLALALCLLLSLLLSAAACKGRDDVSGSVTSDESSEVSSTEEDLSMGTLSGSRYENSYFGFGCQLDSTWTYATKDELLAQIDLTAENFSDESLQEQLRKTDMFYDMMAVGGDGLTNINVVIQNLGLLYGSILSEDAYIQANLKELPSQLGSAGMNVSLCEAADVSFAGETHKAIRIVSSIQDVDITIYQLCVIVKRGSYLANTTITSFGEDTTAEIAAKFYAP